MKTIETQIIINAPVGQVWQTLMQFKNYPKWNPFIQSIEGYPIKGQTLKSFNSSSRQEPDDIYPSCINKCTKFRV